MRERTISADEVRRTARLARLALEETEIERMALELGRVIAYVDRLRELELQPTEALPEVKDDLTGIVPDGPAEGRLRDDEPEECLERERVLAAAPASSAGQFVVPRVIDA
ncbi:MAG: Asp-tRNA(Asn)/Glu-tRNA(Gln) amidotransferase subunit GatC [Acidobacteriota bacterium]|nr:MAG: Asp-tRNA(Asn)/Glu-tRNA(Gln) amidotransferase subunit GatC [Acidobacteriota bacterium]